MKKNLRLDAIIRGQLLDQPVVGINLLTGNSPSYLSCLRKHKFEIKIPNNAIVTIVVSDRDKQEAGAERGGVVCSGSAGILKLSASELATILFNDKEEKGVLTVEQEHKCSMQVFMKNEKDEELDSCDFRAFQAEWDRESGTLVLRERIVSPEISGIGIADPCFSFMGDICTLECKECTCNVLNSWGEYYKFLYG